jgi:hypothetical protein
MQGLTERTKRTPTRTNVAPGFAPVCGDSPRFLRGEPGISRLSGYVAAGFSLALLGLSPLFTPALPEGRKRRRAQRGIPPLRAR